MATGSAAGWLPVPPPASEALLARAAGENFPVALRGLGRERRRHLMAIYGFARLADELGDEAQGDRPALLDELEGELDRVFRREASFHPLLARLAPTVHALGLPREPFARLIRANRRDQRGERYPTLEDLLGYCADSANPVGELVLRVFGACTPERLALSDAVSSALQLAEHWQDVVEDLGRGRLYLPLQDLARFGCRERDLGESPAPARVRALMAFEVGRARELLAQGAPLAATLRGRARVAVAGFVAGGAAALDAIERRDFDVSRGAPRPRRRDFARRLVALLLQVRRGARS